MNITGNNSLNTESCLSLEWQVENIEIRNTIAKYGIYETDIYNFDETGFMMGFISTAMVAGTLSLPNLKIHRRSPIYHNWLLRCGYF
jgi:hypothetical protein